MKKIITNEEIIEKLSKYTELSVLRKEDINLYQMAQKRGLGEYIPKKIKRSKTAPKYKIYTDEEVIELLKGYTDLKHLRKDGNSIYYLALRRGLHKYLPPRSRVAKRDYGTDEDIINIINSYTLYKDFINEQKKLSIYISQNRPYLREHINKLERVNKDYSKKKELRDEEIGWSWVSGGKGNILPKWRNTKIQLDDKVIFIGNDIRGELRMELLRQGFIYIFKPISRTSSSGTFNKLK
jgi:hypothetical protein